MLPLFKNYRGIIRSDSDMTALIVIAVKATAVQ